jgi:glyoxylase-like metal-dependent hydrolase (beta-lactamase superfamily II)
MLVHHLNCATMCPRPARLLHGSGGWFAPGRMVCHCLLVESNDGLVLVDSGLGRADIEAPRARLGGFFCRVVRPSLHPAETAHAQVRKLGFRPADVRHIVLTHCDVDHAGGIADFPQAKVHVYRDEYEAIMAPRGIERIRYRAPQWKHKPRWQPHALDGESFFGFDAARVIESVGPDLVMIPLAGHTRGHAAIAVRSERGWLLHAGDAFFHRAQMDPNRGHVPMGIRVFQRAVDIEPHLRIRNQARLLQLQRDHGDKVDIFCAHDPQSFERLLAPKA